MLFRLIIASTLTLLFAQPSAWAEKVGDLKGDDFGGLATARSDKGAGRADPALEAPTVDGLTGLFRTVSTRIGERHTFRIALHTEMFSSADFLVRGDDNARFLATLAGSYTPYKYLEFFANIRSQANNNDRSSEPGRLDQSVILALGDATFGGKFAYPLHKAFALGLATDLTLLNSVGGVSLDGDSTSFYIGMLSSFYLDAVSKAPLRFHFNFGYQLDNSNSLAAFPNYPLPSLQVEKFALGIRPSRLELRFGFEALLQRWTKIGVTPIVEFAFDIATGDTDTDFDNDRFVANGPLTPDDIAGRLTAWATVGLRVNPVGGLNVEIASDIGMVSPGYGHGPPVVPWNVIVGLSYAYDPKPRIKTVTRERVRTIVKKVEVAQGRVRGRIINAKTLEPVEGAIVTFPGKDLTGLSSDPDGGFLSYAFKQGKLPLVVRHPDYKPTKAASQIPVEGEAKLEVKLVPAPPKVGKLSGTVVDLKSKGVPATLTLTGPESKTLKASDAGMFDAQLKPGEYRVQIGAPGFLNKEGTVTVAAGGSATLAFTLSPKPRRNLVRITKGSLRIRRKVHFATNTADIKEDSRQLLDSVAHVLLANPRIRKLEIQGHTDNRGSMARNMTLSQARAEAVRDYLLKAGVQGERLMAKGYGPTKPKRPNITRRNRAANRRVEFRIIAQ